MLTATHYSGLALGMLLFAVYGSLIPFQYEPRPLDETLAAFRDIAWYDPWNLAGRGDWIVSVVLYLILSYLLMGALCVDRPRRTCLWAAPAVLLFGTLLSVAIEFVQLYFPPRTVSVNDIVVEVSGCLAGTVLWISGGQRITSWMRRAAIPTDLAGLARRLLPGYVVLLLIIELMPFDFTISPAELTVKYEEDKIRLVPFGDDSAAGRSFALVKIAINMACFFPLGFLKVLAAESDRAGRWSWRGVLVFALMSTTLVEVLQLFVYSRVFDPTDIFTGTAAVCLGWLAGDAALAAWRSARAKSDMNIAIGPVSPRGSALLAALLVAWLAAILYCNWSPFDFTTDPLRFPDGPEEASVWGVRRMFWLPFVDYYWGSKYQALDLFLRKSLSFLPLGILAALASPRLYQAWAGLGLLGVALAAALVVEAGRYFLPARAPSVTDVLLQCGGAWVGFQMTLQLRRLLWAERLGLIGIRC
jgi:VanZ family protein